MTIMYNNNILKVWRRAQLNIGLINKKLSTFNKLPFPVLPDTLEASAIKLSSAKLKSEKNLHFHEEIKKVCLAGGGEKGQLLHVKKNKKVLPRERIRSLLDENSDTLELCTQVGLGLEYGDIPGGSAVCTIGKIHGQYCVVTANDGTLKGGTFFPITVKKTLRAQEVSHVNRLPKIHLVDSGGSFLPLQSDIFPDKMHGGRGFYNQAVSGSVGIPQLALVCGSCTAGGAYIPMMCDDSGIVHKIGTIFLGGPPLVKAATGENISAEDLGGATLHCSVSGCSDYFAGTEQEGFEMIRDAFATLDISPAPLKEQQTIPRYDQNELDVMCGVEKIDKARLRGIISRLVDDSRFREFKHSYGQNLIAGYAFLDKTCIGIISNCGPLSYEDGMKGSHFIQNCRERSLPIVFLQNSGPCGDYWDFNAQLSAEEAASLLRGRAAMITALSCSEVPKVAINIGGCHGDDNYTMCGPSFHPNFLFCWPGTETTLHLPSSPSTAEETLNKKSEKKSSSVFNFPPQSSWFMASRALNDGIISPSETRNVLIQCLRIFEQKDRIQCKQAISPIFRF